jgi:hypothetical protein
LRTREKVSNGIGGKGKGKVASLISGGGEEEEV